MNPKWKHILAPALSLTLLAGVVTGCSTTTDTPPSVSASTPSVSQPAEEDTQPEIYNSYDNTEELLEMFPIVNPTPVDTQMEKNIQNRLLNGFANYNLGYEAWEAWGDILYTPDSLYNVHAVHMTLEEYQQSQQLGLKAADIQMGNFNNMIICDDWCAIRYDITSTSYKTGESNPGSVMEFVHFKDYGEELGTRVVEGWAGTRGVDFEAMTALLTEEEQAQQQAFFDEIVSTVIPNTDGLAEKYPVRNPTGIDDELGQKIKEAILQDFDAWNQGADAWTAWADSYYDSGFISHYSSGDMSLAEYKDYAAAQTETVTRLYFENMLISGDWAAIHYRTVITDPATGEKTAGSVMQFLHFTQDGDGVHVTECWTK